jgi:beta-phosphoglucomutase
MKKYIILCLFSLSLYGAEPRTCKNGVVFDLEGTLAPTEWVWFKANGQILKAHGITIDDDAQEKLDTMPAGCGLKRSIELLKERFALLFESVEDLTQEKIKFGQQNIQESNFEYYPGAEDFLAAAKKRKLGMAIATNCGQTALTVLRKKLNLPHHFGSHIYNPDHVDGKTKPNPDLYLYAVEQLGLHPRACIAFEDSLSGARAAEEAELYVVGYNSSNNPDLASHSHMVVKEWSELDVDKLVEKVTNE